MKHEYMSVYRPCTQEPTVREEWRFGLQGYNSLDLECSPKAHVLKAGQQCNKVQRWSF